MTKSNCLKEKKDADASDDGFNRKYTTIVSGMYVLG